MNCEIHFKGISWYLIQEKIYQLFSVPIKRSNEDMSNCVGTENLQTPY